MPKETDVPFFKRLLYAFLALLAGDAAMLLYLMPFAYHVFALYAIFSFAGWVLVGLPIAVLPARVISNFSLPIWMLVGVLTGPLALSMIILLLSRGHIAGFARTSTLFPISIVVSTVSSVVYWLLLRKKVPRQEVAQR